MTPSIIIQDFSKICRCCMEVASYDIFKTYFENEPLSKLLLTCTALVVPKNDTLPKNICQSCLQQLISSYIFYQKVGKTQTAILEVAKVLDKAKPKKGTITNDHDYLLKKAAAKTKEEDQKPVVKIEQDGEDYEQDHIMPPELEESQDIKYNIKENEHGEQEYWLEESNDTGGDSMENYAGNNVFGTAKFLSPHSQFQLNLSEDGTEMTGNMYEQVEDMEDAEMGFPEEVFKKPVRKKLHTCQVCSESFYTSKELNIHAGQENHPQKFCTTCYEFFHSYSDLIKHCMETKHERPQIFKCPYCFKKFENKKWLSLHIRAHYKSSRNLKPPQDKEGNMSCSVCRMTCENMFQMRQHYRENVETHLTCCICLRRFSSMPKLLTHQKVHAMEKPFECNICGMRYVSQELLDKHVRILHIVGKRYKCSYCPKGFVMKNSLLAHERLHLETSDITTYLCSLCGKMFPTAMQLKKHTEKHLMLQRTKQMPHHSAPHECELCGKILSCKATLYSHMRNVHEKTQKLFPCVICGKVLKTKTSLELHVNYHTGNCPFKCDICGKSFTNATTLKSHSMIHTDERPYACHICNKAFKQKPHLNTHILTIHTGIKPFACTYCDKTFALNGNLSQHLKTHTGCDSPFVCTICNKAFYFASRLRKHEKIHMK